ncbi:MAG: glycoside hydrolase family 2 protein [Armatimonadetes bacterium]|nr:glycoside hydrolase family 2 protein [Armatimonadota bacterium]
MHRQSLDGCWEFRGGGSRDWMPATVPGCVHTDLLSLKRIPDPFVGDNERLVQWVAESDFEYRKVFDAEDGLLAEERLYLECDGLDTIATLYLNGRRIGQADNMFVRWRFDVSGLVKERDNELIVRFTSPLKYTRPRMKVEPLISPSMSIPGAPYIRKAPYQFGWDWGPKLPTMGIWRSVRLCGYSLARIEDVHIRQMHTRSKVVLTARVLLERYEHAPIRLVMRVTSPDGDVDESMSELKVSDTVSTLVAEITKPKLWYPRGYGEQPLYNVTIEALSNGTLLDAVSFRIGLRTLKLVQKPDRYGNSFTFVVNGIPIFCKGANWIPADIFPSRVSRQRYEQLLKSAAEANFNMLRVWGGGIYEDEVFYDLCDELGILVWHDFMFSCSVYPGDDEFIENVVREAVDNIRRIRHHPCLALWCGNNEMEWGWVEWGWSGHLSSKHKENYDKLFHNILPKVCAREDPDTPYWASSPSSGTPFVDPNGESSGDGHYWEVWHGMVPFTEYRKHFHRFVSEFGFQSLPHIETIRTFADEKDLNLTSYVMEYHQRHPRGNELMITYLARTFRLPKDFESLIYLTQVLQAEAIRCGVEHWRRNRHRVSGTLYWQLNDCWQVASWSSIDYFGRWKALHYAAKRFYAPVLLSAEEDGKRVQLHITNDTLNKFEGLVRWSLETLNGDTIECGEKEVEVAPQSSGRFLNLNFSRLINEENERRVVLVYELLCDEERMSMCTVNFVPPKHLELEPPEISFTVNEGDEVFTVVLSAKSLAKFVWLYLPGYDVVFSDNCFDLPAGRTVTIAIMKIKGLTARAIERKLRIKSLIDSYA